jgi:hypothetical protein
VVHPKFMNLLCVILRHVILRILGIVSCLLHLLMLLEAYFSAFLQSEQRVLAINAINVHFVPTIAHLNK